MISGLFLAFIVHSEIGLRSILPPLSFPLSSHGFRLGELWNTHSTIHSVTQIISLTRARPWREMKFFRHRANLEKISFPIFREREEILL